ncbi:hypothetical protein RoPhRER2_gp39 [Rhodococcus phage RER2]|uniref:Uncharacterized protein n=3 Tax=Rerduovirus TaxID=1982375 RepID=G9FHT9_9CAUD|nr:hypothetical protein RoPhRER2_gp39 [Rhodococcus phage RER2]YP_009189700.1 hypothetical protein AU091_gp26 [Rhodococcus phage CosmicSans]ALA46250.1 hypothetical protein PBI_RHODALYSA_47 [Rhodococcus phage Rhodalysa]ALN97091.1 hypothetical protein SEA_TWAMP_47 [Rhodococcus phage TWAMP]ALO80645.1 hypothetical protein SEA_LILLIE_47 [Rhodococcus phage Lillie]ASR84295.1 hypothetical protein SEA_STCROIX_46 [Rhodococcus phage StCroix]ASR84356.1 hypothetical protein SEA_NAIAD_46 [Rhodococcus phage 
MSIAEAGDKVVILENNIGTPEGLIGTVVKRLGAVGFTRIEVPHHGAWLYAVTEFQRLNVGDKVRVLENPIGAPEGYVFEITDTSSESFIGITVEGDHFPMRPEELEVVS